MGDLSEIERRYIMSDTLVIHPYDTSTEMLKYVYENRVPAFDICRDPNISKSDLASLIKIYENIIILGHGTGAGLAYPCAVHERRPSPNGGYFMIDDSFASLLREKKTISMWCYSDLYFKRNHIKGFHTGMIISERAEAELVMGKCPLSDKELYDNMVSLSKALSECLDKSPEEMREYILAHYNGTDPISEFNRKNIIVL